MSSPEPEPAPAPGQPKGQTKPSAPPPESGGDSPYQPGKGPSYHWSVVVIVVVLIIAVTAIIFAIIDYLKWSRSSIPISTTITSHDNTDNASDRVPLNLRRRHPFTVPDDYQVEFPTIKGFLSKMAREKPITYSARQIAEFTNSYSNILGSGSFGVVYKGRLEYGVQVAVKVLTNNNSDKIVEEQFMAEVGTLGRTYHVNLVRLYGFCFDPQMKALVYEYMENGSLEKFLFRENRVDLEKLHVIAVQTAKGLSYLHEECEQRIIHYDIKPENVLLDGNLNPKVADFGLAKLCNRGTSQMLLTKFRGTAGYAAPEMWKPYPVTYKCDVYSFGILLLEIVGRRRHWDDNVSDSRDWLPKWVWNMFEKNDLAELLLRCGIEERDRRKAERMLLVALWCIQNAPEARPLMSNVVQMLEGHKEITPPPCPLEDTSTSASGTIISDSTGHEIELVVIK